MGNGIGTYKPCGMNYDTRRVGNLFTVEADPSELFTPRKSRFDSSEVAITAWHSLWPVGMLFREDDTGQLWCVVPWARKWAMRQRLVEIGGSGAIYPKGNCTGIRRE